MTSFSFKTIAKDKTSKARTGELVTPHGSIMTPCYIPVGTQATVKALSPQDLHEIGAQIVLGNTYHLHLQPGEKTVESLGGLGKFMGWSGPTMTDSGGYQVFSLGAAHNTKGADTKSKEIGKLSKFSSGDQSATGSLPHAYRQAGTGQAGRMGLRDDIKNTHNHVIERDRMKIRTTHRIKPAKIDEEGVTFWSHKDGSEHRFTPASSIAMQEALGADLIVAFDDHESPIWNFEETKKSLERSDRWGIESLAAHTRTDQLMYGVTHGGMFEDLRIASAKFIDKHFEAVAIGGSYSTKTRLYEVIGWSVPHFSQDKPRHLLGIAEIEDLFEAVERGMDFFDCVAATRRARHGSIYIGPSSGGTKENSFSYRLLNAEHATSVLPLEPGCMCQTCQTYSRGYVHHLLKTGELLGYRLTSYHNVWFVTKLMEQIREAIAAGQFAKLKERWL